MTRGIHLRRLKTDDLTALGVPESALLEMDFDNTNTDSRDQHAAKTQRLRAEMARVLREELEKVLVLLAEALPGVASNAVETPSTQAEEPVAEQYVLDLRVAEKIN